jgi:hypothetical protein
MVRRGAAVSPPDVAASSGGGVDFFLAGEDFPRGGATFNPDSAV